MNAPSGLPESIRNDVGIYLAPDEKIQKALSPFAGNSSPTGQVWLILTDNSVIFHTRESGKEPLVALLPRKEIGEIEYFQRPSGVQLTFVPKKNTSKVSRLNFGVEKLDELEDFCEDLADYINFKKETSSGIKTYAPPLRQPENLGETTDSLAAKQPRTIDTNNLKHAATAIRHADKPAPALKETATQTAPTEKVFTNSVDTAKPAATVDKAVGMPDVKIVKPAPSAKVNSEEVLTAATGESEFNPVYVVLATLISLLVAFIWYKFFMMLAGWKSTKHE